MSRAHQVQPGIARNKGVRTMETFEQASSLVVTFAAQMLVIGVIFF